MKRVYPVVFTEIPEGYLASAPDWEMDTHGRDLAEAIAMARDAIGLMGIDREDENEALPEPSRVESVLCDTGALVSMVDIDFDAYRRANERRTIRRNVSLPSWLNAEAESVGLNVSAVLQEALKQKLGIAE
jgi:predicted RNase H-like HicB family nuclease